MYCLVWSSPDLATVVSVVRYRVQIARAYIALSAPILQYYMVATSLARAATVHAIPGLHMLCKYGIYDAHGAYLVQLYILLTVYTVYMIVYHRPVQNGRSSSSHYIRDFWMAIIRWWSCAWLWLVTEAVLAMYTMWAGVKLAIIMLMECKCTHKKKKHKNSDFG